MSRSAVAEGLAVLAKADAIQLTGRRSSRFSGEVLIPDVAPLKDHTFAEVRDKETWSLLARPDDE